MADSEYEQQVSELQSLLSLQRRTATVSDRRRSVIESKALSSAIDPSDVLPARNLARIKNKHVLSRIIEAHSSVSDYSCLQAKLAYIGAWKKLPEFGLTYFVVSTKPDDKRKHKPELLAIGFDRIMLVDPSSGHALRTWRYSSIEQWKINWDNKKMELRFNKESVSFRCVSSDVRIVNEFIGGYIFLSMRTSDASQALDEAMFYKLTESRK